MDSHDYKRRGRPKAARPARSSRPALSFRWLGSPTHGFSFAVPSDSRRRRIHGRDYSPLSEAAHTGRGARVSKYASQRVFHSDELEVPLMDLGCRESEGTAAKVHEQDCAANRLGKIEEVKARRAGRMRQAGDGRVGTPPGRVPGALRAINTGWNLRAESWGSRRSAIRPCCRYWTYS